MEIPQVSAGIGCKIIDSFISQLNGPSGCCPATHIPSSRSYTGTQPNIHSPGRTLYYRSRVFLAAQFDVPHTQVCRIWICRLSPCLSLLWLLLVTYKIPIVMESKSQLIWGTVVSRYHSIVRIVRETEVIVVGGLPHPASYPVI